MNIPSPLHILIVEDSPEDAELMIRQLEREGVKVIFEIVEEEVPFIEALQQFRPHLIFSDYRMPHFSGLLALEIVQELCPWVPLIFVTGTVGEEIAAETVLSGASGFVLKSNLSRLFPMVQKLMKSSQESDMDEKIIRMNSRMQKMNDLMKRVQNQLENNKLAIHHAKNFLANRKLSVEEISRMKQELEASKQNLEELNQYFQLIQSTEEEQNKL